MKEFNERPFGDKTMRRCPQENLVKTWLDGELDAAREKAMEHHAPACAACSEAVLECRQISERLRALLGAEAPPPRTDAILETAFQSVEEEGRTIRLLQRVALLAAAVLICAVGFIFFPVEGTQSAEASRDNVMALVLSDPGPGEDY